MSASPAPDRWCEHPISATNVRRLQPTGVASVLGVGPNYDVVGVTSRDGWLNCADVAFTGPVELDDVPYEIVAFCGSVWAPLISGVLGDLRTDRVGSLAATRSGYLPAIRGRAFTSSVLRLYVPDLAAPLEPATFTMVAWASGAAPAPTDQAGQAVVDLFSRPAQRWVYTATGAAAGATPVTIAPANPRGGRVFLTSLDIQPAASSTSVVVVEGFDSPVRTSLLTVDFRSGPYRFAAPAPIATLPGELLRVLFVSGNPAADLRAINAQGFYE